MKRILIFLGVLLLTLGLVVGSAGAVLTVVTDANKTYIDWQSAEVSVFKIDDTDGVTLGTACVFNVTQTGLAITDVLGNGRRMYWQYTASSIESGEQLQGLQLRASWGGSADSTGAGITGIEIKARAADNTITHSIGTARAIVANVDCKKSTFVTAWGVESQFDLGAGGTITTGAAFRASLNNSGTFSTSYAYLVETANTSYNWDYGLYMASGQTDVGIFLGGTQAIQFYDALVNIAAADDGDLVINADATLIITSLITEIAGTTLTLDASTSISLEAGAGTYGITATAITLPTGADLVITQGSLDLASAATGTAYIKLNDGVADALSIVRDSTDMIVFKTSATPLITITPAVTITGALTCNGGITGGFTDSSKVLFVDVGQTGSNETGKRGDPYKTIQGAIDAIATLADNSDTVAYTIMVAPGTYAENLLLQNAELFNLSFIAMGGPKSVFIDPASGSALASKATNTNLHYLYFKGFTFNDPIDFLGAIDNTLFLSSLCVFEDCYMTQSTSTTITLVNLNRFTWLNGGIHILGDVVLTNAWLVSIRGQGYADIFPLTGEPGSTTFTASTSVNQPYHSKDVNGGGDQCTYRIRDAFVQRDSPTLVATGSGVPQFKVEWAYSGLGMGLTIPSAGVLYAFNAVVAEAVTIASEGTAFLYNSAIKGALTNNGTLNCYGSTEGTGLNVAQ